MATEQERADREAFARWIVWLDEAYLAGAAAERERARKELAEIRRRLESIEATNRLLLRAKGIESPPRPEPARREGE